MHDWIKVVTEPLGLAGFALFLVFGLLSRVKAIHERRWLGPVATGMAAIALAGALALAYLRAQQEINPPGTAPTASQPSPKPDAKQKTNQAQTNTVEQTTTGAGSPVVQGVQGDVTVTVDQSSGPVGSVTNTSKKPAVSTKKVSQ